MNAKQLLEQIIRSAHEHDENTSEDNGDMLIVFELALRHLEGLNQLNDFVDTLAKTDLADVLEFEDWLKPDESYVDVDSTQETYDLFEECRRRGLRQAAGALQNEGEVSLTDFERGLATISDVVLYGRYECYIAARVVKGKEADT